MTAKEQGLPELPQTPFCLRQHDETGRTTITDGPIDPILWQRWNKVSSLYTADQMRAYALAALASDTGERGVLGLVAKWLAESDRLNGGAHMPFTDSENSITALALNRCAYELSAALRAQPAGGGERKPNHRWLPTDVMGSPLREYAPGKWESAMWPSDNPPESGGQGEAVAWAVINHCDNDKVSISIGKDCPETPAWREQVGASYSVRPLVFGDTHPPAQASGAVTEAMVEAGLQAAVEASDARLPRYSVVRQIIRAAIERRAALAQGGGNER